MSTKSRKLRFFSLFWDYASALSLIALLVLLWHLGKGPVKVNFLRPYIIQALTNETADYDLSVGSVNLELVHSVQPVKIIAKDVQFKDKEGEYLVEAPRLSLSFSARALLKGMLIFQMFPAVLSLVALYALFDRLGQYIPFVGLNTHGGVIFAYMGGIALHVWTIKGYFETIDGSLEEAAALDGATPWQAFRLVLLPLSVPILAVVFILSFIAAITEVPVASLLLRDVNSYTLAVGMQQYLNPQNYLWGDFAAAAVLSAIPITVVFLLAQRWLVNGLTAGGVKG